MQKFRDDRQMDGYEKESRRRDELLHVNGVAYIEGNLKLAHLRILIAIVSHLQSAIQFKVSRRKNGIRIPDAFLPQKGEVTKWGQTRILTIPVEEFHLGIRNGGRLRTYFDELQETRIVFPDPHECSSSQFNLVNRFSGLIVGYSFPAYSRNVDIYLQEEMVGRLLLTEEGYSSYSQSSALSLTNKYTVRIYWLISSWRNKGGFVISLSNLRRILCLSEAYERFDNVSSKIIEPARRELRARFPIWFEIRQYESGNDRQLAFKVKIAMTDEQRRAEMRKAYDICFNILTAVGANIGTIGAIFAKVELEDLRPFMAKLMDLVSYVRENRHIKDVNRYLTSSMDIWFADWLERYERIDQEEGQ